MVLLLKHFCSWCNTSCNYINITTNSTFAVMNKSNLMTYANICSCFPSWLITSNFSSVTIFFHQFFTWISLGDVDWHFSLMLVRKDSALQVATKWAVWLCHHCNQSIHMTDRVTVSSLTFSLQKISVATDLLLQIALNWKLSLIFEKWFKFLSRLKWYHVKRDLPVFICDAYYFFFIEIYVVCVMRVNR